MNINDELKEARKRRDATRKWFENVKDSNHPLDRKQAKELKMRLDKLNERISKLFYCRHLR